MLSFEETVSVAAKFTPLWFVANYIYKYGACLRPELTRSVSLAYTSVASNTILSATSAFFTLVFGALYPGTPDDAFSWPKLVS
jgi:solute carrier family 35 protein F5